MQRETDGDVGKTHKRISTWREGLQREMEMEIEKEKYGSYALELCLETKPLTMAYFVLTTFNLIALLTMDVLKDTPFVHCYLECTSG